MEAAAAPQAPRRMMRGIGLKILSTFVFTLMSAGIKYVGETFPTGQVVFCRSLFAIVPVYIWLALVHDLSAATRTRNFTSHMRRGVIGSTGMFCGFAATTMLPLSDATAISYAAPLITVVLAAWLLKETVRIYRWSAVMVGFAGVLVMLSPYLADGLFSRGLGGTEARGMLLGVMGAICSAFATIEVRRLTGSEHPAAIVFYFMLQTTLLGLATGIAGGFVPALGWVMPTFWQGALLVSIGLLGGIGQITMTLSFRHADASIIASFDYLSMIWAVGLGWLVFSELPQWAVIVGAAIVISSGIFVIWRERRLGIRRDKQRSVAPSRVI